MDDSFFFPTCFQAEMKRRADEVELGRLQAIQDMENLSAKKRERAQRRKDMVRKANQMDQDAAKRAA